MQAIRLRQQTPGTSLRTTNSLFHEYESSKKHQNKEEMRNWMSAMSTPRY